MAGRYRIFPAFSSFLAWVSAGCSPQGPALPTFEAYDSAGVEVVESYSAAGFDEPWILSEEPLLRIGKDRDEDPYLFGTIMGAARLGDGSVVVLDNLSKEIRRFDAHGQHMVTFGGEGDGPGEFRSALGMQRFADTLMVMDRDGTVARFDPSGRLLNEIPAQGLQAGDRGMPGEWRGVLANGVLWGARYVRPPEQPQGGVLRNSQFFVLSDVGRTDVKTLGEYRMGSVFKNSRIWSLRTTLSPSLSRYRTRDQ